MKSLILILLLYSLAFTTYVYAENVYQWKDENGAIHFSDKKTSGDYRIKTVDVSRNSIEKAKKSISKITPEGINIVGVKNDKQGFVVSGNTKSKKLYADFKKEIEDKGLGYPFQKKMYYQLKQSGKSLFTIIDFELLVSKKKIPEQNITTYHKRANEVAKTLSDKEWVHMITNLERDGMKAKYTNANKNKLLINGEYSQNKDISIFFQLITQGGLGEPSLTSITKKKFKAVVTR